MNNLTVAIYNPGYLSTKRTIYTSEHTVVIRFLIKNQDEDEGISDGVSSYYNGVYFGAM